MAGAIVQLRTDCIKVCLRQRVEQREMGADEVAFGWEMLPPKLVEIRLCFGLQPGGED